MAQRLLRFWVLLCHYFLAFVIMPVISGVEARTLLGQLVYESRSLTRQVTSFIDDETKEGKETQRRMVNLTIAFAHALRHRFRHSSPWADVEGAI